LSSIYESGWDKLEANKDQKSFCQCVSLQFNRKLSTSFSQKKKDKGKRKPANISKAPLPIHPKPSKSVLAKSKFYKGDQMTRPKSYTQASKGNINEIIKIKDAFPKLSPKFFLEIYKIINNLDMKGKLKFNMTTKGPSHKQVIIPMGSNNLDRVIARSNVHVANINSSLKNIKSEVKSEVTVDFIRPNNKGIIVITNKVAATSDLKVTEDYMKNLNNVDLNDVMSPRLSQSKSYLKILGILYLICYGLKLELRLLLGKDLRRR